LKLYKIFIKKNYTRDLISLKLFLLIIKIELILIILFYNFTFLDSIGDWGLGIGDWAQSPIPNPQSPIPNPQSPIESKIYF
jgi:hypothetical protein